MTSTQFITCLLILCLTGFVSNHALAQSTGAGPAVQKPFVLGQIDVIHSVELAEDRTLNIYLPAGYSKDSMHHFPVIYLLDGSADEDFIHIAGLVQFATFSWVHFIPKSIVVGIANTNRRRDFTYPTTIEKDKKDFPEAGHSGKFISFVENELQPYIRKNYSTNSNRTLIGQSLGGLLASEILFKRPTLFEQYIIVSPSLWWDNESLLALKPAFLSPAFRQKTAVYVAVGNEGKVMIDDANRLVDILKKGAPGQMNVDFQYFANENHATIFHQAVYKAFEHLNK